MWSQVAMATIVSPADTLLLPKLKVGKTASQRTHIMNADGELPLTGTVVNVHSMVSAPEHIQSQRG